MPNLYLISDNLEFKEDLQKQIELYAPDFHLSEQTTSIDAIILDENKEQLSLLKKNYSHTPILALLNKNDEMPNETPLVKYIQKPFSLYEFINTLLALVNLAAMSEAGNLSFNGFELNSLKKEIKNIKKHETIKLTEKEVAIIHYLYKNKGKITSRNDLLQEVWGYNLDVTTHTIETHIYRLRQKVEHDDTKDPFIITEDGGYMLKF